MIFPFIGLKIPPSRTTCLLWLCLALNPLSAQLNLFNLSILDSLSPGELRGNSTMNINWNKTATHNVVVFSDINLLFPLPQHSLEFHGNLILNTIEDRLATSRYFTYFRADLWKFDEQNGILSSRRFFPEIFLLQAFDYGRGLNVRWQTGINGVVALKRSGEWRLMAGTGIITEYENWRIVGRSALSEPIFIPPGTFDYLEGQRILDRNGNMRLETMRSNFFLHFVGEVAFMHINSFFAVQTPFSPPFKDLPVGVDLPLNDQIYPRFSLELAIGVPVNRHLRIQTRLSLQHDRGQPSLLVPNSVFTLAQGISYQF
jgi:hypothetical protein